MHSAQATSSGGDSSRGTMLSALRVPTPNTVIKKTKTKMHLGTGSAGLAARRPCGLTASHRPGYGAHLPDEAVAGIGYYGLY